MKPADREPERGLNSVTVSLVVFKTCLPKKQLTICTQFPSFLSFPSAASASSVILFFILRSQRRHWFFLYPMSVILLSCSCESSQIFSSASVSSLKASLSTHDRASVISPISLQTKLILKCSAPSDATKSCRWWRYNSLSSTGALNGTKVIAETESTRRSRR
jgi:hypothetical protein